MEIAALPDVPVVSYRPARIMRSAAVALLLMSETVLIRRVAAQHNETGHPPWLRSVSTNDDATERSITLRRGGFGMLGDRLTAADFG